MYQVKYSPVIGWDNHTFVWSQSKSPGYGSFPANHRAVFHMVHQNHGICLTTVSTTVVDPSHSYLALRDISLYLARA